MCRIGERSFEWFGVFVVLADVSHELLVEVFDGREDAAGDDIALNASEPVLDLVQPGRVRRRVVHVDALVLCQEGLHERRLVAAHVVADDVDFAPGTLGGDDLFKKADELLAGVARCCPAKHLARLEPR